MPAPASLPARLRAADAGDFEVELELLALRRADAPNLERVVRILLGAYGPQIDRLLGAVERILWQKYRRATTPQQKEQWRLAIAERFFLYVAKLESEWWWCLNTQWCLNRQWRRKLRCRDFDGQRRSLKRIVLRLADQCWRKKIR